MRKSTRFFAAFLAAIFFSLSSFAQNVRISGKVTSTLGDNLSSVSVKVKNGTSGTTTDASGRFSLDVPSLPVTLVISSVGYDAQELTVNSSSEVSVNLVPADIIWQEVVVSATRTPQRILEAPVSIERVTSAAVRNAPAASYYDVLGNLKGVDLTTSSLTFQTPTTRGFAASGNLRLNQIVDGMDNQAPGLNFSVGSVIGISELDLESMELLPGASSALYGPGGMNGTLLINSKNPFRSQGLSFQVKQGIMHISDQDRNVSPYYNWNFRWAKAIGKRFAFKISTDLIKANDWLAQDYRNYKRLGTTGNIAPGSRATDPNYDGVNMYGDETTVDIVKNVFPGIAAAAPFLAQYINSVSGQPINVSRTGYKESEVVSPETINYKVSGALHYKITNNIEAIAAAYWGTGNTVYTGSDRYSLRNLSIGQYKLELNGGKWYLRAYTTQEDAGESYNATVTTRLLNEAWLPSGGSTGWYAQYTQAYLANKLAGMQDIDAHNAARAVADKNRPAAGSTQFKQLLEQIRGVPISKGGGLFVDKTNLYNYEGQYNFSDMTKGFADILIGGNFKRYVLNSEGTLFADSAGKIPINEYGTYIQASRNVTSVVRLTLSGRYDKNTNFDGRFTPRATATIKLSKNNNLRLSYQTAYRFPSTQQQWINLNVGGGVQLIGGVQQLKDFYGINNSSVYSLSSVQAGSPKNATLNNLKPESVTSYEVGYRGLNFGQKLLVDAYGYYGQYSDFILRTLVVKNPGAASQQIFSVPVNSSTKVNTYGFGLSLDYRLAGNFVATGNYTRDAIDPVPAGFISYFNAPSYRANLGIANTGFGFEKRFGMSLVYRWQDQFYFEGDFANGQVNPIHTLDAQISYKMPTTKTIFKLGATNLLNQYYRNAPGNPSIGGLYYVSFGYNVF